MTEKILKKLPFRPTLLGLFLAASLFAVGLFNEYLSCAAAVFLCGYLIFVIRKNKTFVFRMNLASVAVLSVTLFYLLSCIWAVDSGMAFIGAVRILPLPLFMLAVMQEKEPAESFLGIIPSAGVVMTIISGAVMIFSPRNEYFAPAGRLSGFLQYSNTFALVLLIALIVTVTKETLTVPDFLYIPVLIAGIIFSGSRTVYILTILSVIVLIVFVKNKTVRIVLLCVTAGATAAAVIYAAVSGNFENVGRFLSASLGESTFLGRLLYWQDALPLLLRYPFGTGYLGFHYLQQSIQTGLYAVRFVHNDFMQLALDVGWLPTLLFIAATAKAFFKKGCSAKKRLLIFTASAHCFFDMDLQFIAVFMIFILLLDIDSGKAHSFKPSFALNTILALTGAVSLYLFVPLVISVSGNYPLAQTLYPWNTDVNTVILVNETDPAKADKAADAIIAQNEYVTVSYSVKAAYAFSQGDFVSLMKYKDKAIANAPLIGEEYEDYLQMLIIGEQMYLQMSDTASADYCEKKINAVLRGFYSIPEKLSELGRMIDDQPKTELSSELASYFSSR